MGADDQNVEAGITGRIRIGRRPAGRARRATMRAVVLDAPGPPSALAIRELPVPVPSAGQVLIRVRAFGLNRFELYLRLGLSEGVTFPRVPGIEAVGVVPNAPAANSPRVSRSPRSWGAWAGSLTAGTQTTPASPPPR